MADRRPRFSIRAPVTLFVVVLCLIVTLTVLWNVLLVQDYQKLRALAQETTFHWTWVWLGSALFITIIVLSSILSAMLIGQIRWSQRQSNFIASVSHELNSPLSSIKLFAQTLRKKDLSDADRLDFVDKILFDVERLHRLISNILRAAEMDHKTAEMQVVPQTVELNEYLEAYLDDAEALYPAAELELELNDDYLPSRIDPVMFRQVLDNLLDNAVRYRGKDAAHVTLRARRVDEADDPEIEVQVCDKGAGIDPVDLPSVFERFYRSENPVGGRQKGTGIGLYVVRSILHAHGGDVAADSAGPGQGTTITLTLPAHPEVSPGELQLETQGAASPTDAAA
ncbi:MAG: HAMP domain-containing histidine kinase [Thermoanaerobaculia bacterium]|nr:HAMP domain-containing histidine kinase [Thermoanaerobaculia bacterium]